MHDCHNTICHTPAYSFEDAELISYHLEKIVSSCRDNRLAPAYHLYPCQPFAVPLQPIGHINCMTPGCVTKSGQPTCGHKGCIGNLCPTCCQQAASRARHNGKGREACLAHRVSGVSPLKTPSNFLTHSVSQPLQPPHPPPSPPPHPVNVASTSLSPPLTAPWYPTQRTQAQQASTSTLR